MTNISNLKRRTFNGSVGTAMAATAMAATVMLAPQAARAASLTWVGGSGGSWASAGNWSPRAVPGPSDTVFIGGKNAVNVPGSVTVQNLRLGKDAQIVNGSVITVTGWTSSDGLLSGAGSLDVPEGAAATFNLGGSLLAHADVRRLSRSVCAPVAVDFGKIKNKGKLKVNVSSSVNVSFDDIQNEGETVLSTGGISVAAVPDAARGSFCQSAPSEPIEFKSLKNKKGVLTLKGNGKEGRAFYGKEIENKAEMICDGAVALTKEDFVNEKEARLALKNGSVVASVDKAKKFENDGLVQQVDGDSILEMEWDNEGILEVNGGSLVVAPPDGKEAKQKKGRTTLNGGLLEVSTSHKEANKNGYQLKGGVLDGSGIIVGDVINDGGQLNVGHSPGLITINGNYTQTANGIMNMEIWGTIPGLQYDQLQVEGNVYVSGVLNVAMGNDFKPGQGNTFYHLEYIACIGEFKEVNIINPVPGRIYIKDYTTDAFTIVTALVPGTPAPPPSTSPSVAINSPAPNAVLTNLTSLSGSAQGGNIRVAYVRLNLERFAGPGVTGGFWAGGDSWSASPSPRPTYWDAANSVWSLPVSGLLPGSYALTATVTNAYSVTSTTTHNFTVGGTVVSNLPSVTINSPAPGSTLANLSSLNGTATGGDTRVGYVKLQLLRYAGPGVSAGYWIGGTNWTANLDASTIRPTYWTASTSTWSLPIAGLAPANYRLRATVTNAKGVTTTSESPFSINALGQISSGQVF